MTVKKKAPVLQPTPGPARDLRIVVLPNGFVYVGALRRDGYDPAWLRLSGGYNLRKWGTTKGLSQLALFGPTKDTVMDQAPEVAFHELAVVHTLICDQAAWATVIK